MATSNSPKSVVPKSTVLKPAALLAAGAASVAALVVGLIQFGPLKPAATGTATVASPAPAGQDALAAAKSEAAAVVTALGGTRQAADGDQSLPAFDIARIERSGEAVIAGRAAPGASVELLRNGERQDRVVADASGQFVMQPPPLPSGDYELTLRATSPDGKQTISTQSVVVALPAGGREQPVVALTAPNRPSVVLSQPGSQANSPTGTAMSGNGVVAVQSVESEPGGRLHVSGRAPAGAALRLYLNDSFLAAGTASADGRLAFSIDGGVKPGGYRVRIDQVDAGSGAVRGRAEVPFEMPDTVTAAPSPANDTVGSIAARPAAAGGATASTVVVPKIATLTVSRGDSLWRISRTNYGEGTRYAVIYKANREQIRNPDLIYPGQVFVVPATTH